MSANAVGIQCTQNNRRDVGAARGCASAAAMVVESGSDVSLSFGALLPHLSRNNLESAVEVVDVTSGVLRTQGLEHITEGATQSLTTPVAGD